MNTSLAQAIAASEPLRHYMHDSYNTMRLDMGVFTAAFPFLVWLSGVFYGKKMPGSLSAYYWLIDSPVNTPRIVFAGGLIAVALFFFVYRGFRRSEGAAFNLAAVFAVGVALIPKANGNWDPGIAHAASAIALFLCLGYVLWFRSHDTLEELAKSGAAPKTGKYSVEWHRKRYRLIGVVMALSPVFAAICDRFLRGALGDPKLGKLGVLIFFIESFGIWSFAWYWFLKSAELKRATEDPKAGT
jgi:hypothetical protein